MFMHGFTYSGHPVACAVALRNIQIIEEEDLPENAGRARRLPARPSSHRLLDHPNVGNVRGKGLMLFVELVADKAHQGEVRPRPQHRRQAARRPPASAASSSAASNDGIAIAPPLIITQSQCDEIAGAIADALTEVLG